MKTPKYNRDYFLKFLKDHNITTRSELESKYKYLSTYSYKNKDIIGELPLQKGKPLKWTFETCKNEALKYPYRSDFEAGSAGAYTKARKSGWLNEVCAHMKDKSEPAPSFDKCLEIAKQFSTKKDLKKNHPSVYAHIIRKKWGNEVFAHMPKAVRRTSMWNESSITRAISHYKYKSDFLREHQSAYVKAARLGIWEKVTSHMPRKIKDISGLQHGQWTIIDRVDGDANKVKCQCSCGRIYIRGLSTLRYGTSKKCHRCSTVISEANKKLYNFVIGLGFADAVLSDRSMGKEIDVYIPSKKFAIEHDGLIWHSEMYNATEKKELERYKWFQDKGISCFRIFSDEFKKSEQLIYRMIKARLVPQEKIKPNYVIKFISNPSQYRQFFEENHLDGYANAKFAFGAFDNDNNLISCASFRHYMRGKYRGQLELARFCSDTTKSTYGCFGKLIKEARAYAKSKGYKHLLSASDNRLGNGGVYANNGFVQVSEPKTRLNYYYYVPSKNIKLHRASCKKMHPPIISEDIYSAFNTQPAQNEAGLFGLLRYGVHEKFYKVWGWGNKLWVLEL